MVNIYKSEHICVESELLDSVFCLTVFMKEVCQQTLDLLNNTTIQMAIDKMSISVIVDYDQIEEFLSIIAKNEDKYIYDILSNVMSIYIQ